MFYLVHWQRSSGREQIDGLLPGDCRLVLFFEDWVVVLLLSVLGLGFYRGVENFVGLIGCHGSLNGGYGGYGGS